MLKDKKMRLYSFYMLGIILLVGIAIFIFNDFKYSNINVSSMEQLNNLEDITIVHENNDFIQLKAVNKQKENVKFIIDKQNDDLYKETYLAVNQNPSFFTKSNLYIVGLIILLIGFISFVFIKSNKQSVKKEQVEEKATVKSSTSKDGNFELSYSDITFQDVAGYDYAKEELQEIIDQLQNPDIYKNLGAKMIKGGVLYGPPGTGKTFLAKALSGEAGVPFISVSGTDFVEEVVGRGANRIRELFQFAKQNSPCIVFIDEMDAVGAKRSGDVNTKEWDNTVNAILVELDGFKSANNHIVVLGATNKLDVLDDALLRPGRLDRKIEIGKPDYQTRVHILNHLTTTQNRNFDSSCDLEHLAHMTYNFSAAELEQVVNEAILLSARKKLSVVSNEELLNAFDKVTMGISSKKQLNDLDKKTVAYHEAGHAVITKILKPEEVIQKVTILPQGQSLGFVSKMPKNDIVLHSKKYLEDEIAILLAGRVSEEIFFGTITTGAQNDFERATSIINHMENKFAMYDNLAFNESHIDFEVINRKLGDYYNNLKTMITDNETIKRKIDVVAKCLLKKESLSGKELDAVLLELDKREVQKV